MDVELLTRGNSSSLHCSLHNATQVNGLTHNFYRYPARMSPNLAQEVIAQMTSPDDVVLDPFMGGGTTIVEALASGRRSIGIDLNPLATFVATVKTTPLSGRDISILTGWAKQLPLGDHRSSHVDTTLLDPRVKNLPAQLIHSFEGLLCQVLELPFPRQRRFARCALLSLGQWAVDGKAAVTDPIELKNQFEEIVQEMDCRTWATDASSG